jgi:hypothetical protein
VLAEQADGITWSGGGMDARGFPVREATSDRNLMRGFVEREDYVSLHTRMLDGYSILGQAVRKPPLCFISFSASSGVDNTPFHIS